jgi:hypothetical protein
MARDFWCQESDSEQVGEREDVCGNPRELSKIDPSRGDILETASSKARVE